MRGNAGPLLLLTSLLALLGGYAWLTRHPDAEILRRAESWPYVGPLASGLRQRYATPPPAGSGDAAPPNTEAAEYVVEPRVPPVGDGYVWVLPGTAMYREPSETSPKILQFDAIANVTRLESRGDWYRVWRRGQEGWVHLEGYRDDEPPYGREPEPPRPLPSIAPAGAALAAARELLGAAERALAAGPYALYTDSGDDALAARLDRVAAHLGDAYAERYGCRPEAGDEPREVVVLYDDEADYRRLQNRSPELLGLRAGGHTGSGLVLLYVGGRAPWEVSATLIHELVHTLNRRSLGPALPSWLDEGLADDLASSEVGDDGRIVPGTLGGERRREENRFTMRGGVAALWQLRDEVRAGSLVHVRELLHLDWDDFVRSDRAGLNYATSAFWVRFLLDGEDGRYAAAFRDYLRAVARGEPTAPEALRQRLGLPWNVVNARFQLWIDFQDTPARIQPVEDA